MAQVGQVAISSDIPKVLEPLYTGLIPGTGGKPDTPVGFLQGRGLIQRGVESIFPGGLSGQQAFAAQYAPVINAGLMGAGQVAGMSPFQQEVGTRLGALQGPQQFGLAQEAGQQAAAGLQSLMGLQAPGIAAPELDMFQLGPARQFSGAEAQQYMSPYMQNVVDIQQRQAIDAARRAQLGQNLAAARQGTYGGARQTLLQGERESGLRTQLGDIQARGLQEAFGQAQSQFERDRAAQMGVGQQNLAAALGVQQLGAGQSLEAQRANQAAALQAGQQRLGAAQGLEQLAQTFGGLGAQQLAGELDVTRSIGAFGDFQRNLEQQRLDAQRQALMQQAEYGQTQVGQLSNLLRGIPMTSSTQTTTTPSPSTFQSLMQLGLGGVGLYNAMNPMGRGG
jgi:hypothetical protein